MIYTVPYLRTVLDPYLERGVRSASGHPPVYSPANVSLPTVKNPQNFRLIHSFLLRRNAVDVTGTEVRRPEKVTGKLKAKMVKARGHLDDLVEQTAEQFRKMEVRSVLSV